MGRNKHYYILVALHHALAAKARVDARIYGAVDKILFLVANFGQVLLALQYVDMAGAAATDAPTVVLQLDIVVESNIQHRLALGGHVGLVGLAVLEFEGDIDDFHE